MTSALQTNTQTGDVAFVANGAIPEGYLVKISTPSSGGASRVILPTDVADVTPFVAQNTAADTEVVYCRPLSPNASVRVYSDGAITAGLPVYLSGTFGKVVTSSGAGADTYWSPGIAEETSVDGQLIRIRPTGYSVVVT